MDELSREPLSDALAQHRQYASDVGVRDHCTDACVESIRVALGATPVWPDERELMRIAYRNGFRDGSNRAAQRIGGKIIALASPHWPDDEAGIDSGPGEVADTPPTPGPVQEDDAPV